MARTRRRGGDVYTEKKAEQSQELQQLGESGVAKQMIEKYKKEGALLHGGRRRKTKSKKLTRRRRTTRRS
jgi:hypothetical protein